MLRKSPNPVPRAILCSDPGGYSHIVWVGVCRWVRESPTLYKSKFCKFCDPIPEYPFNLLLLTFLSA